ncbi:MAG: GDP-mannose 4,6-dehydratase [Deltaproteobacteria bacterium]|nr:GDP-mannose 4,6-dehydratase [Deltaproteobacteria bacterium]
MPTAFITGITGQDGSFLAEQLLDAGWSVVGLARRSASRSLWRLAGIRDRITMVDGDLLDMGSMIDPLREYQPDHVYNLGAQSFVATSWRQPLLTGDVTALGAARLLEAVRIACPEARVYQAGSSEMFGLAGDGVQSEATPFHPRSPYGVAKVYAHHLAINYRESHGMFVVGGILFNHESERRSPEFVTRKITMAVAAIKAGKQDKLRLGRVDVRRDWGFAGDYTRAMTAMLEQDQPKDFVIATGKSWSVDDFAKRAFDIAGLKMENHVEHDPALMRPAEIPNLCGDATKAHTELNWQPQLSFDELVTRMTVADLKRAGA